MKALAASWLLRWVEERLYTRLCKRWYDTTAQSYQQMILLLIEYCLHIRNQSLYSVMAGEGHRREMLSWLNIPYPNWSSFLRKLIFFSHIACLSDVIWKMWTQPSKTLFSNRFLARKERWPNCLSVTSTDRNIRLTCSTFLFLNSNLRCYFYISECVDAILVSKNIMQFLLFP